MPLSRTTLITGAALVAVAGVAAFAASGGFRKPAPRFLTNSDGQPEYVVQRGDDWWWLERPMKGKWSLVRAGRGHKEIVASADEISGYDATPDSAIWSFRNDKTWSVARRTSSGTETLWSGVEHAGRPSLYAGAAIWALVHEGRPQEAVALPALGPFAELCIAEPGKPVRRVGRLLEQRCDVLGARAGIAYVMCNRFSPGARSAVYEVSMQDGHSRRLAAEEGKCEGVLLPGGDIVWAGLSQDSSQKYNIGAVRSIDSGGKIRTRADWLPSAGTLCPVGDSLYYVGGTGNWSFWPVGNANELSHPVDAPAGYLGLGVGERSSLVGILSTRGYAMRLFEWSRP